MSHFYDIQIFIHYTSTSYFVPFKEHIIYLYLRERRKRKRGELLRSAKKFPYSQDNFRKREVFTLHYILKTYHSYFKRASLFKKPHETGTS